MSQAHPLENDLGYVRSVVEGSSSPAPRAVYFLWAAIVLVGFPMPDYAPEAVGRFWMIAGPLGWVASAILGGRHARAVGQFDRQLAIRHGAHWGLMLAAIALAALMPTLGVIEWRALGALALLFVAFSYLQASLHLDRQLVAPGALMIIGYLVLLFEATYAWTITGILVALGLVVSGVVGGRSHGRAQA
jgi:hypothetical protein